MEVERKFVLGQAPGEAEGCPSRALRQGYLAIDGEVEVRVRDDAGERELTIKSGHGGSRGEHTIALDRDRFEALWPLSEGRRIAKSRTKVPLEDGLTAEVDVYEDDLAGLVTVEVEFADEASAAAFTPPDWLGREVTGDSRYANQSLARAGEAPA